MKSPARAFFAVILCAAMFACARGHVDRAEWQRMSHEDRVLYVSSLVGAEKVKDAKGGGGKRYDAPADRYVKDIDEAYARGDARDPEQIFKGLSH